jgi:hypothetical protein
MVFWKRSDECIWQQTPSSWMVSLLWASPKYQSNPLEFAARDPSMSTYSDRVNRLFALLCRKQTSFDCKLFTIQLIVT